MSRREELLAELAAADAVIEAHWHLWDELMYKPENRTGIPADDRAAWDCRFQQVSAAREEVAARAWAYFGREAAAVTAGEPVHAVAVELARRKGNRAAAVLDGVLDDCGFAWRGDGDRCGEIARQFRALGAWSGDLAADLTTVAVGVLTRFGHPCDPAGVRAAVTRHLEARP